ncbi:MAG: leucine-rich repeat domain-containing protein [Promethearchaeia archaeon]
MPDKQFRINSHLTVKFEDNKTVIYVNGEKFTQCKYLLLVNPSGKKYVDISSIDEASAYSLAEDDITPEFLEEFSITPELEFWGHCSNLQAWYEYSYDTRLLHSNLAFPLLKKLSEAGDKTAMRVFKEEIGKRFYCGYYSTVFYLYKEGFLDYLSREELYSLLESGSVLSSIEQILNTKFLPIGYTSENGSQMGFIAEKGKIKELYFYEMDFVEQRDWDIIFSNFSALDSIIDLNFEGNNLGSVPESIGALKSLRYLKLSNNRIRALPRSICNLSNLEILDLSENELKVLPDEICDLKNLKYLTLNSNSLESLPESIGKLRSLERLFIRGNNLSNLSDSIGCLENLRSLIIGRNPLEDLPESLLELDNLDHISIKSPGSHLRESRTFKELLNKNKLSIF